MRLPKWFSFPQITAFFVYFSHLTQLLLSPVVFFSSLSRPVLAVSSEPEVQLTLDQQSNELVLNVLDVKEATIALEYVHDDITEGITDNLSANKDKVINGRWLAGTRSTGDDEILYELEEGRVSIHATDLNSQTFLFEADFKVTNDTLWLQNGEVWSTFDLESGRSYQAPQNDNVKIEFTKIETTSTNNFSGMTALNIKEVSLSSEQQTKLGTVSATAYDITSNLSSLPGASFEYSLTLPNPTTDSINESDPDVQVQFSEDGEHFQDVEGEEVSSETVTIRSLDHFTVFVVTTDKNDCPERIYSDGSCYDNLQDAINESSGNEIQVKDGTYVLSSTLDVNQEVSIVGESEAGVIIDGSGNGTGYGLHISADNVTIKNVTIIPPIIPNEIGTKNGGGYAIHVSNTPDLIQNLTLENITIEDGNRTSFDIHGVDGGLLKNLTARNNAYGNGMSLTGSSNITVEGFTSSNNSWGGIALYNSTFTDPDRATHDITLLGNTFNINESTKLYAQHEFGMTITGIDAQGFEYIVRNPDFKAGGDEYDLYQINLNNATTYATSLTPSTSSTIEEISTGNYYVAEGMSIQKAIDEIDTKKEVHILSGTFEENILLNKNVDLLGTGSNSDDSANTILKKQDNTPIIRLSASGDNSSDRLTIKDLRIEPDSNFALEVHNGTAVSHLLFDNVKVDGTNQTNDTESEAGFKIATDASANDLVFENCSFDNLTYGWYFAKHGDWGPGGSNVDGVLVNNTTFQNNDAKGLYIEKLSNAEFNNITVHNNGLNTGFWDDAWNGGFDLNLKGEEDYQNITINNSTFINNGLGVQEGAGLMIKARDDGSDYGAHPATLTNVNINSGVFSSNERGIRFGEPEKDNAGPTNVEVHQAQIFNNQQTYTGTDGSAYGGLINMTKQQVDATNNWWGHSSGPFDNVDDDDSMPTKNPDGQGNAVVGNVLYENWAGNLGFDNNHPVMQNIRMFVNGQESYLAKPGDIIKITAEILDESDINKVQIWIRENPWNPNHNQITWGTMNNIGNDTFEFVFTLPDKYESDDTINENFEGNYFNFRPFDEYGNSHIGWAQKFTVDSTPPSTPANLHILDHQGNNLGCDGYTNNRHITIDWDDNPASDNVSYYRFDIKDKNNHRQPSNSYYNGTIRDQDDEYMYQVWAVDAAGNESLDSSEWCSVNLDRSIPEVPKLNSPESGAYVSGNPKQSWESVDGAIKFFYESSYDQQLTQPIYDTSVNNNSRTVGGNQTIDFWWHVKAIDAAGNESGWSEAWNLIIDNTNPESEITDPTNEGPESEVQINDWTGYIAGTASDNNSGVNRVNLEVTFVPFTEAEANPMYWDGSAWQATATAFTANSTSEDNTSWEYQLPSEDVQQGFYTLTSHAVDNAGNEEQTYTINLVFDHTIPEVTATTDPVAPNGVDGWFITPPTVTLTATDNHELDHIEYQWGSTSGKWLTYDSENPLLVTEVGQHFLYYRGVDVVGNQAEDENIGLKEIKYDPAQTGEVLGATDNGDGGGDSGRTGGGEIEPYVCNASEPGDITGLTVADTGLNSITLSLNTTANATNYNIIFTDTVTGTNYGATDIGPGPYTLGNLVVGRQYVIQVFAENDCQPGNSASITASTDQGGAIVGGPTAGGQPAGEVLGADTQDTASVGEEGASINSVINSDAQQSGEVLGASTDCENFPWWWLAIAIQLASLVVIFIFASDAPWIRLGLLALLTTVDGYLLWRWLCSPWLWIGGVVIATLLLEILWRYFSSPSEPQIKISKK